jgi:hypothetical protein
MPNKLFSHKKIEAVFRSPARTAKQLPTSSESQTSHLIVEFCSSRRSVCVCVCVCVCVIVIVVVVVSPRLSGWCWIGLLLLCWFKNILIKWIAHCSFID